MNVSASHPSILESPDQVLSTLNRDGSRRWLNPRLSLGRFLSRRRVVAYVLLVLYNALPWIPINGKPAILLDIAHREFTFFGTTFLPTDTLLLMLFVASIFVTVFLVTALFGRLWCGWACPQTVYMEFIFRPIERLFLGATDAKRKANRDTNSFALRAAGMYLVFGLVAFHLANTFLAYFVGAQTVFEWSLGSPFAHPAAFVLVLFVTGLILLDFGFLREQICIVMCPYGRLQSVMLDRSSLIISYDERRGEPRGKKPRGDVSLKQVGDCIDCRMCVTTCPTGIDIRSGLQMECIGCAQCIDACDAVMDKIGRARGLIRYSSQEAMESARRHLVRPRIIIYPVILTILIGLFITVLLNQGDAYVTVLRASSRPYVTLPDGRIANEVAVKIMNRASVAQMFELDVSGIDGAEIGTDEQWLHVPAGEEAQMVGVIRVPRDAFHLGRAEVDIIIRDDSGDEVHRRWRLQGPWNTGGSTKFEERESSSS